MAFKATNTVPQKAYDRVKIAASNLKANCATAVSFLAGNNASYTYLASVYSFLYNANAQFNSLKTTPGLADYAKAQEDDATYDVVAEFAAMQSAISSTLSWMDANVPLIVTVKPLVEWPEAGTAIIATEFTSAQTAGLRAALTAVADSIE